jgi:hypothetical protein
LLLAAQDRDHMAFGISRLSIEMKSPWLFGPVHDGARLIELLVRL